MKGIFTCLVCGFISVASMMAEDKPTAYMKAEYEAMSKSINTQTGDTIVHKNPFVLQIARDRSYYYHPQTYYVDSLENDPNGKLVINRARDEAYEAYGRTGVDPFKTLMDQGFMRASRYKCLQDFPAGKLIVRDSSMGDRYRYEVDMSDLVWEIGDSTKTVMGYDCVLATADYHGRHWTVWFAPEIAVQSGPWQLCGLPGLIMEAVTEDGNYGFTIQGLQKCDEPLKDPFEDDRYFKSTRKAFLKSKAYTQSNRAQQISAMTGGKVKIKTTEPQFEDNIDFIETDYK